MIDPSSSSVCIDSDFDTRESSKKICQNNGLGFEVINQETLRVTGNTDQNKGNYLLLLWSYHADSTGNTLWSVRATPLTITIST